MSEKSFVAWLAGRRDVSNLSKYIRHADLNRPDDEKLKRLAERASQRTQREQWIFSGVLDAESINGLDDVLRVADHWKDYELIPEVSTDRELGEYLVEHDLLGVEFPQEVRPYLDYVAIGAEYYSSHGGACTLHGVSNGLQRLRPAPPVSWVPRWHEKRTPTASTPMSHVI